MNITLWSLLMFAVIQRALHVEGLPYKPSQREQIFYTWCTIGGKVYELIINKEICIVVASMTLIDMLQLPTMVYQPHTFFNSSGK